MRKFLVLEITRKFEKPVKITVKGLIEQNSFPSYDRETLINKYGTANIDIKEISENCHVELL